ncbi:MAG: tetratricopeptide repeat protein [Ignavibacteria bacterium]
MKLNVVTILLIVVMITLYNCSSKNEEQLFNEAKEKINSRDFSSAQTILEDVLNEFPNGKYAAEVNFELGKIYQSKVIPSINEQESSKKAVKYYGVVAEKFPESPNASRSLFMLAFIQANELGEYDKAGENYNKFLKKYPQDELASSAKAELANLGIPAEEILKRKLDQSN